MPKIKSRDSEKKMSIQYLLDRFNFDFDSGYIFLKSNGKRADKLHHFRSNSNTRYRQVQVPDPSKKHTAWVKISAHRMIWAASHGRWPLDGMDIDHLDSDTSNNSINNLEEVAEAENIRRGIRKRKHTPRNVEIAAKRSELCVLGRMKLRALADVGNSEAAFALAQLYQLGIDVNQNDDEALYWYKFASQLGHVAARKYVEAWYNP